MPKAFSFSAPSFASLDTSSGIENLSPSANRAQACTLSAAINVRFTENGGWKPRDGFTQAADLATTAKVDDCVTLPVWNVTFWKSGTAIKYGYKTDIDAGTTYTTGLTRTATEKDYLFAHERNVYALNETDNFTRIAVSRLTAINSGAGTFSLESGDGDFFASGTVIIRGISVTGGTLSGDNMTGTTGLTGAMAIGDIVIQTSTPSGAPKGYCMAEFEGSALVGKGDTVFASLPSTDQEPELFYDFTLANGATAKRLSSRVRCIVSGLKVALIGKLDGIDVAPGFEPNTGALLTSPLSRIHGVPNNRCIVEMDNKFAILTNEGRILIALNGLNGFELIDNPDTRRNFDYPIAGYVKTNKDQTDNSQNFLHYNPVTKTLKATVLMKTGLTEDIIAQTDIGAWSIDDSKNMRCRLNVQGAEYAGDDSDDKIHHDDYGYTDNGAPIVSRVTTGKLRLGRKGVTGDYLNLVYGGMLSENGQFTQRIIHNDVVDEEVIMAEDLIADGQMTIAPSVSLGEGEMGAETIGGEGSETEVFGFNIPYEMMVEGEYVQLEWEVSDEGSKVEIRYFELSGEHEGETLINNS
jgi:hypothetical protein